MARTADAGRSNLEAFVEEVDAPDRTVAVVNRTSPRPYYRMLEDLLGDQPMGLEERDLPNGTDDAVVLIEDGAVVATSPLESVARAILTVNSDLYITGARGLEESGLPDVVAAMGETPFHLRGYPESDREKLLLIAVSRYIERLAHEAGGGRLRTSFQQLSRIDDERGTREVYERLAGSGVDVHVYGTPDWTPPPGFDLTMHGGYDEDFRDSWFVVHVPEGDGEHAALVAIETEPRVWDGFWTDDPDRVVRINRYIERNL